MRVVSADGVFSPANTYTWSSAKAMLTAIPALPRSAPVLSASKARADAMIKALTNSTTTDREARAQSFLRNQGWGLVLRRAFDGVRVAVDRTNALDTGLV